MSEKLKQVSRTLNYLEHLLVSVVNNCVSVSVFASLVGVSVGIASSAVEINLCNHCRN